MTDEVYQLEQSDPLGDLEVILSMLSGLGSQVPAGLGGALSLIASLDPAQAAGTVSKISEALTYVPRTEGGQEKLQAVADNPIIQALGDAQIWMGDKGYEMGGPIGGVLGELAPDFLDLFIGSHGGAGAAKNAALSVLRKLNIPPGGSRKAMRELGLDPDKDQFFTATQFDNLNSQGNILATSRLMQMPKGFSGGRDPAGFLQEVLSPADKRYRNFKHNELGEIMARIGPFSDNLGHTVTTPSTRMEFLGLSDPKLWRYGAHIPEQMMADLMDAANSIPMNGPFRQVPAIFSGDDLDAIDNFAFANFKDVNDAMRRLTDDDAFKPWEYSIYGDVAMTHGAAPELGDLVQLTRPGTRNIVKDLRDVMYLGQALPEGRTGARLPHILTPNKQHAKLMARKEARQFRNQEPDMEFNPYLWAAEPHPNAQILEINNLDLPHDTFPSGAYEFLDVLDDYKRGVKKHIPLTDASKLDLPRPLVNDIMQAIVEGKKFDAGLEKEFWEARRMLDERERLINFAESKTEVTMDPSWLSELEAYGAIDPRYAILHSEGGGSNVITSEFLNYLYDPEMIQLLANKGYHGADLATYVPEIDEMLRARVLYPKETTKFIEAIRLWDDANYNPRPPGR